MEKNSDQLLALRHSMSHIMAEAVLSIYPTSLAVLLHKKSLPTEKSLSKICTYLKKHTCFVE